MTPSHANMMSLLTVVVLLFARPGFAQESKPVATREEQRQSLEEDFLWPKVPSELPLKTYGDVKEALQKIEGLKLLLDLGRNPGKLAKPLREKFPINGRADEMMIDWYNDIVADNALNESKGILIYAGHWTRKTLGQEQAMQFQQDLKLIHPPGLTPVLLEYKVSQFEITSNAVKLKSRTPEASYELFLASDTSYSTATIEVLEPYEHTQKGPSKIYGDLSLSLLSKPRKIVAETTPPQSLKQYQRYLRTGRLPRIARYGDFEIRFKSIERQPTDAAQLVFELNYPDRPFYFESHMTPSLVGKTTLTFPQRGETPNTIICKRSAVNGQYEALDIVEDTAEKIDWDLPITGLEIEVAPLLKRLNLHIEVDSPMPR